MTGIPQTKHLAVLPLLTDNNAEGKALADGFTTIIIDKLTWLEKFHDSLWTIPAGESFRNRDKPQRTLQRLWGCNLFISGDLQAEKNSLHLRLKLLDAASGRQMKQVELQGNMANLSLFQDGLLSKTPPAPRASRRAIHCNSHQRGWDVPARRLQSFS